MDTQYTEEYFNNYLSRGRFTKKMYGEKTIVYKYWTRYLKKKSFSNAKILEIGCGLGFFGKRLQEYFSYIGSDISGDALKYAKERNNIKNVVHSDAGSLPFGSQEFDVLVAFDVIEHLPNPKQFFMESSRILKHNGLLILSTPNTQSFGVHKKSKSKTLIPSMIKDKTHISLLEPDVWIDLISSSGYNIIRKGTDTLWDIPYYETIPVIIQKLVLVPINNIILGLFGCLNWSIGENLIIVARKSQLHTK